MISKILSLLIALAYITIALLSGAGWQTSKLVAFLLLPMACIWFSDEMGNYTGLLMQGGPMTETPGCLVVVGGWLLLLLPVFAAVYFRLHGAA